MPSCTCGKTRRRPGRSGIVQLQPLRVDAREAGRRRTKLSSYHLPRKEEGGRTKENHGQNGHPATTHRGEVRCTEKDTEAFQLKAPTQ